MSSARKSVYEQVKDLLAEKQINFSEKEHKNEGYGTNVAQIHGVKNESEAWGAKALVVKLKKPDSFCLAVIPFHKKLDTKALQKMLGAKSVSFANAEESKAMTECEPGSIPPFSFNSKLSLVVDESLKTIPDLYFNIGRLDRSIRIKADAYFSMIPSDCVKKGISQDQVTAAKSPHSTFGGEKEQVEKMNEKNEPTPSKALRI